MANRLTTFWQTNCLIIEKIIYKLCGNSYENKLRCAKSGRSLDRHVYLPKSASMQSRTSPSHFADTYLHPTYFPPSPPKVIHTALPTPPEATSRAAQKSYRPKIWLHSRKILMVGVKRDPRALHFCSFKLEPESEISREKMNKELFQITKQLHALKLPTPERICQEKSSAGCGFLGQGVPFAWEGTSKDISFHI